MTTRDPRRRTHEEPVAESTTVPTSKEEDPAANPRTAAPGIPIARPDPSKPYPEEDEETRRVHHAKDIEAGNVGDVSHTGPVVPVVVVPDTEHKE